MIRCEKCSTKFDGALCPKCGWRPDTSASKTVEVTEQQAPVVPTPTGTRPAARASVELMEWRPRSEMGADDLNPVPSEPISNPGPASTGPKTPVPATPVRHRSSVLPVMEIAGLVIAVIGGFFLWRIYRPPSEPPITESAPAPVVRRGNGAKAKGPGAVATGATTAKVETSLPPGRLVVRSPSYDLNVMVDGSPAGEESTLVPGEGEVAVSAPPATISLHLKYERRSSGLAVSIEPKPPAEVRQGDTVLAHPGEVAHVMLARRPLILELGDGKGTRFLFQYRQD